MSDEQTSRIKPDDYIEGCLTTESVDFPEIRKRLHSDNILRLLHATMGMSTEANEILTALKAHIFYGRPLDFINLIEEHGDLFWFAAIFADAAGFSFEESMEKNLAKLKTRYPDKFREEDANTRNLDRERKVLEGETNG